MWIYGFAVSMVIIFLKKFVTKCETANTKPPSGKLSRDKLFFRKFAHIVSTLRVENAEEYL